jgi:hypothetical protein
MVSYTDRYKTSAMTSKPIDGAANASRSTVEDMGIDHRRFDIIMAQEFLDRSDIVTASEQLSGKRMPEPSGWRTLWKNMKRIT